MKRLTQKIDKPWGCETCWAINNKYFAKILHINRSARLSMQYHEVKDKTIYVLSGVLLLQIGKTDDNQPESTVVLKEGESFRIQPRVVHRLCAPADGYVRAIEVSTPEAGDIVRIQDDYGRTCRVPPPDYILIKKSRATLNNLIAAHSYYRGCYVMWLFLFSCLMSMEANEKSTIVSLESRSMPSCNQDLDIGVDSSVRIGFEIPDEGAGWGSGNYFKLGKYKFIITAAHVVDTSGDIFVLDNDQKVPVKVVYSNTYRDIAIVVPERDLQLRPKKLKINSQEELVGLLVNYTGYPSDLGKSTYVGYISKSDNKAVLMQSFALPGSSGSVVFDKKGRAIGVVSAVKVSETMLSPFPELVESLVFVERFSFINKRFLKEVFMSGTKSK